MLLLNFWKFLCYIKVYLCEFAWVWTYEKCKCLKEKDIPLWIELRMVWLRMTLMELGLTNKNALSTYLTQEYVHISMSLLVLECCWNCLSVTKRWLQEEVLIKLIVMTMLWLGEGCSSYQHDKFLCVWCIKEWVNKYFACLCCIEF